MERIGPDVGRELRNLGPEAGAAGLEAAWPRAVGAGIARHAWPARLGRDGTLHVATESATWAFELSHLAPQLLSRLREELADAAPLALRFAVGPLAGRSAEDEPGARATPPRPSAGDDAEAAELTAGIADETLRELVRRTAAASLAGRRSDR